MAEQYFRRLTLALALTIAPLTASATSSLAPPLAPHADDPPLRDRAEETTEEKRASPRDQARPQTVFYRADDFAALHAQSLAASYAFESGQYLGDTAKSFGIRHRVQAGFGATAWLKLSAEQNMKQNTDSGELRVGVLAPQLRFTLRGMLPKSAGDWPLDVSAFFGSRIRIQGRREPSVVFGVGSNTPRGPFHFTINQAVEITKSNPAEGIESAFGPRYDLGVGYELGAGFVGIAELWGHAAWSRGGYVEQEHYAGPSLLFVYAPVRFSAGGATGWRNEGDNELWDVRAMFTTGLEI